MYLEEATIVTEKYKRVAGLDIVILLRKRGAPMCRPIATRLHVNCSAEVGSGAPAVLSAVIRHHLTVQSALTLRTPDERRLYRIVASHTSQTRSKGCISGLNLFHLIA